MYVLPLTRSVTVEPIASPASQTGTRGGRRIIGDYVDPADDMAAGTIHPDTIGVFPNTRNAPMADAPEGECARGYIPYRSLLPKEADGLLVACRAFSSDVLANDTYNWIPHCAAMGEAAGTPPAPAGETGGGGTGRGSGALQQAAAQQGAGWALVGQGRLFTAITAVVVGGTALMGGSGGVLQTLVGVLIVMVLSCRVAS